VVEASAALAERFGTLVDNSAATPRIVRGPRTRHDLCENHGRCAMWARDVRGDHATCAATT